MPMGDRYWRNQNLYLESFGVPYKGSGKKDIRGTINELAFMVFCKLSEDDLQPDLDLATALAGSFAGEAIQYTSRFTRRKTNKRPSMSDASLGEAAFLAVNQLRFFKYSHFVNSSYVTRPKFGGCGILASCEGDVLTNDTLFEVKAGERTFRITDLRQLLTYSALAHASGALTFSKIGLLNPRTGTFWIRDLDVVCRATSGLRSSDVFEALVNAVTQPLTSR